VLKNIPAKLSCECNGVLFSDVVFDFNEYGVIIIHDAFGNMARGKWNMPSFMYVGDILSGTIYINYNGWTQSGTEYANKKDQFPWRGNSIDSQANQFTADLLNRFIHQVIENPVQIKVENQDGLTLSIYFEGGEYLFTSQ